MEKKNPPFPPEYDDLHRKADSINDVLNEYSGVTSAHGVPRIITSKSIFSKIFWMIVTLVALGAFMWQGSLLFEDFRGHPYTTQIDVVTRTELQFPAVTVCNMNLMRRSAMVNTRFESLIEADGVNDQDGDDYSWWFDWSSEWWLKYDSDWSSSEESDSSEDLEADPSEPNGNGSDLSGDSAMDNFFPRSSTSFSDIPDEDDSTNQPSTTPNQNDVTTADVVTDTATSDGIPSSFEEQYSSTDTGATDVTGTAASDGIQSSAEEQSSSTGTGATVVTGTATSDGIQSSSSTAYDTGATDVTGTATSDGIQSSAEEQSSSTGTGATVVTGTATSDGIQSSSSTAYDTGATGVTGTATSDGIQPSAEKQSSSTGTGETVVTGHATSIPSFVDEESSSSGTEAPVRKRRSGLRLIPDPATGKMDQRRRLIRRKRQLGVDSSTSSERPENYDWWGSDWDGDDFDYERNDWNGVTDDNDWQGFYRMSTADDFSDLLDVINPTREELREMGHQAEDFILQCTFDRRPCNYTMFRQFQNKYYGNCFTFNQVVGNSSTSHWTGHTGAQYGLHLTLFTEQPEYVGVFAQEAGVRVAIHPANVLPFPEDDGVVAATGQATNIGIRQRLSNPHGNCTDGTGTNFTSDEYTYTTRACVKSCVQQHLFQKCGCVTDIMMNDTICSPRNKTEQVCRQAIEQFFHEGKLQCKCPIACNETLFVTAVTSSLWPSERYEGHLKTRLTNEKATRILQNIEQTRKNLARVRIYFEELNYEQMIQDPKYTIESLLGGIGGLLGLYIGFSMITVIEVGALVVDLVKLFFRKMSGHTKVVPFDYKN